MIKRENVVDQVADTHGVEGSVNIAINAIADELEACFEGGDISIFAQELRDLASQIAWAVAREPG